MIHPLKYLSLCSGIEAASVAWEPLGWEPIAFAEIEPFPCAVLAHRWPDVPNLGDITKNHDWPDRLSAKPDLIVAGTPCQAFSVAGLRRGLDDPRGNLTLHFLRILEQLRPRWVVWENVPGVLSDKTGAFGAFLGGLGELGYGFAYRIFDAQFSGVPQRRRRVFVVGHLGGDWQRAAAVLFEPESLRGNSPPRRQAREEVVGTLTRSALDGSGPCGGDGREGMLIPETAYPLTARMAKGVNTTMDEGQTMIPCVGGANPPVRPCQFCAYPFDHQHLGKYGCPNCEGEELEKIAAPICAANHHGDQAGRKTHLVPESAFSCTDFSEGKYQPTNTAAPCLTQTDPSRAPAIIASPSAVRRLTPLECERLQGFPDHHTLIPGKHRRRKGHDRQETLDYLIAHGFSPRQADELADCPDGPRYKALGNSMAVPVVRWIGRKIASLHES